VGPEVEGVFTLFAILFVFVGVQILALGLIGEYIGRIYLEVRRRPRYVIQEVYDHVPATASGSTGERADPRGA
jgi:undecaprenyl-phosphate 4-deoxy-4-formamido-L-arabinose transferase